MIHRLIAYSLILLGIGGTIYMAVKGIYSDEYATPSLSRGEAEAALEDSSEWIVIDVRTVAEFEEDPGFWNSAINIPLLALEKRSVELAKLKAEQVLVVCPTGNRSRQGARILRMAGIKAYYLAGGLEGVN